MVQHVHYTKIEKVIHMKLRMHFNVLPHKK